MEFKLDYEALMEQIKNQAMLAMLTAMIPGDDDILRAQMIGIMNVFMRHGISVDEAFRITVEIGEILNPKTDEKETDVNED